MEITGGRISYKRTVQPAPYESKTAEVEFSFVLDTNDDGPEVAAEILKMAKIEVNRALNSKSGVQERK